MEDLTEEQTKSYLEHSHRNLKDTNGNPIKTGFYVSEDYRGVVKETYLVYPEGYEFLAQSKEGKEYTICDSRVWSSNDFPSFRLKPCDIDSTLKMATETLNFIATGLKKLVELAQTE